MMSKVRSSRWWFKLVLILVIGLIAFITVGVIIAYNKQDELVARAVKELNENFSGHFEIEGSHISPFENFPYISIDLDNVSIYENKDTDSIPAVSVQDIYVGFDTWSLLGGSFEIKKIKLKDGTVQLIQYTDGNLNLVNALAGQESTSSSSSESDGGVTSFKLEKIELENIDVLKINKANNILAEVFIEKVESSFSMAEDHIRAELDSKMLFNLIMDGDTSFLHDKHLLLSTGLDYNLNTGILDLAPSELFIEKASFLMDGHIDVEDGLDLDLKFSGQKPNFDLFLAFVPEEFSPLVNRYDNGGTVYFDAIVKGSAAYGRTPHIEVEFGCSEAFVENIEADKSVNDLFFKGHFTNGALNSQTTSSLIIEDFTARPETGTFRGSVKVENFESPDIEMKLSSEFNLDFLTEFLEIRDLEDVSGKVALDMNFHDIIDLDDPSKAIEKLNESYYTELKVENLNFKSQSFHLPFGDINIHAAMDGHKAVVDQFAVKAGSSDISMTATISDLPAILHHTDLPVDVDMDIKSNLVDLLEITQTDSLAESFNEQIQDLSLGFRFKSSARAFTESPYLPLGEFFITELHAGLTHYPHELHDFNADIIIDSTDFKVIDFTGMIDQSDFHFDGSLTHYELWFEDHPQGASQIDFDLDSKRLQLEDLFSYGGENYVPEDYRGEEFSGLKFHGLTKLQFEDSLTSVTLELDHLGAAMKQHKMTLEEFAGDIALNSDRLLVKNFGGKVGNSEFTTDLTYYLNAESTSAPHSFHFSSPKLDFDQLFSYAPPQPDQETGQVDHEAGFNVFDLPFSNMNFEFDIAEMNYHRYLLDDFSLKGRMQTNHYIYVDTMALKAAGGVMKLNGYFNGSDPDAIYFSPNMEVENVDLDKLLFKFDNFGQDQLVSDNLHGQLTGKLTGAIHMHPDLIPAIDDSELAIDIEVLNGSINNFSAFNALSDYFTDKNLSNVRFDTLSNTLELKNGDLIIPKMNINTSLGFFEISGRQGLDQDMDYNLRIPLKVIARAGLQKLFGRKNRDNSNQEDEIQYRDENKRVPFISISVSGTPDDYKVTLGKRKRRDKAD